MNRENITAIILSAGFSSRMGKFKPLLPLGETAVLDHSVHLFRSAGISDIRVVTGHRADEIAAHLRPTGIPCLHNPDYETGMFSSVVTGVRSLEPDREAFFMLPADIPLVRQTTLIRLLAAWQAGSGQILYPNFEGERGHPPLISGQFAQEIVNWQEDGGLRAFLARHADVAADVAVADEFMLMDMDTPESYDRITAQYERYDVPTARECVTLMTQVLKVDERIVRHCRAVADIAGQLGTALSAAGCALDPDRIVAAGLVHDLARTEPNHAAAGAKMLREMGFPGVADIVAVHMNITVREDAPVTEAEVVHLADKLVRGDQPVSVEERFAGKMEKYGDIPEVRAKIEGRLNAALSIKRRIEKVVQRPISDITGAGR
ncbi:phosphohydrolase [Desulfonema ishimotonii]|uniref:Phosphohydrolase n=1 Tax=Desulfonema ishimotonii TaxID=45657 RepID=A0A401FR32_9BACT|nr:NTP transferase domain-containing protein [Desulfonema ishimotonii]GBC59422.1 phosphohydrolase [Desulfonema ishimotonii]